MKIILAAKLEPGAQVANHYIMQPMQHALHNATFLYSSLRTLFVQ